MFPRVIRRQNSNQSDGATKNLTSFILEYLMEPSILNLISYEAQKTMDVIKELETYGYATIKNVVPSNECSVLADALDKLEQTRGENNPADYVIKNGQVVLYSLDLLMPELFLKFDSLPYVLDIVDKILPEHYILSSMAASRSGADGGRRPHLDGRMPLHHFKETTHISVMFYLDDFTEENGALCVWPYSHVSGMRPPEGVEADLLPGKVIAKAPRGSITFFLGSTWHEIGKNFSGQRRWGLIVTYCRWWVKPAYNYTQCGSEIYDRLSQTEKKLFGFTSIPPTLHEPRHHTVTKIEELPEHYPF